MINFILFFLFGISFLLGYFLTSFLLQEDEVGIVMLPYEYFEKQ